MILPPGRLVKLSNYTMPVKLLGQTILLPHSNVTTQASPLPPPSQESRMGSNSLFYHGALRKDSLSSILNQIEAEPGLEISSLGFQAHCLLTAQPSSGSWASRPTQPKLDPPGPPKSREGSGTLAFPPLAWARLPWSGVPPPPWAGSFGFLGTKPHPLSPGPRDHRSSHGLG